VTAHPTPQPFTVEAYSPEATDLYDGLSWLAVQGGGDQPTERDHRISRLQAALLPLVPGTWVGLDQAGNVVAYYRYQHEADHALANRRVASVAPSQQGGAL
jgi:hypothetical protein